MNARMEELLRRIHELETEVEADLESKRAEFRYRIENHRVRFEREMKAMQRRLRRGSLSYLFEAPVLYVLTAPVIYAAIVPLLLLDLMVSGYQLICFPVYGIPRVPRGEYFAFDRGLLPYLNWIERAHCAYCSYANGLIAYAREVIARTEQFWCPIKHARRLAQTHERYHQFFDYGDGERYRAELERLRRAYPDR
ncbi:MAG: hypothetical protein AB1831_07595 [Pseudomonadota bacterium]